MIFNIIGGIIILAIVVWLGRWVLAGTVDAFRSVFSRSK